MPMGVEMLGDPVAQGRRHCGSKAPLGSDQVSAARGVGRRPAEVRARRTSVPRSFLKAGGWEDKRALSVVSGFSRKQVGGPRQLLAALVTLQLSTDRTAKWL